MMAPRLGGEKLVVHQQPDISISIPISVSYNRPGLIRHRGSTTPALSRKADILSLGAIFPSVASVRQ